MPQKKKTELRSHGIHLLLSPHPLIRRLKRHYIPSSHGNKFWASSWLLMEFLKNQGLPEGASVMDLGCGWGLAGIYCAKRHNATVTGVDMDPDVFPFLRLHAQINEVHINELHRSIGGISEDHLKLTDFIIGADICFWNQLGFSLKRCINRALRANVKQVFIADPGRTPFFQLGEYYMNKGIGEISEWTIKHPKHIQGQILKITSDLKR